MLLEIGEKEEDSLLVKAKYRMPGGLNWGDMFPISKPSGHSFPKPQRRMASWCTWWISPALAPSSVHIPPRMAQKFQN